MLLLLQMFQHRGRNWRVSVQTSPFIQNALKKKESFFVSEWLLIKVLLPREVRLRFFSFSYCIELKPRPERQWQKQNWSSIGGSFTPCPLQEVGPPVVRSGSCLRAWLWAEGLQVRSCPRTTEAAQEDPSGAHPAPHCSANWRPYSGPGQWLWCSDGGIDTDVIQWDTDTVGVTGVKCLDVSSTDQCHAHPCWWNSRGSSHVRC